jgi:hypothetical protein
LGIFATALLAATPAAPVPKVLKAKPPSMEGSWRLVELNLDGSDDTKFEPVGVAHHQRGQHHDPPLVEGVPITA